MVPRQAVRDRLRRIDVLRVEPRTELAGLSDQISARADAILELEGPYHPGLAVSDIPADLLTASASGLDPHISVAAAELQAPRIAQVRGLSLEQVRSLIDDHTEEATLGFLGEQRVNVLDLNLALAQAA